jgi:hypothetical protein
LGEAVFDTTRRIDIDGVMIRVLDQPYLTAHLALHAGWHLTQMQVVRLLELVLVAQADARAGRLDWSAVAATLERTGTLRFAYPALALADVLAPGAIDRHLLRRAAASTSARMRRVLEEVRRAELGPLDAPGLDAKLVWAYGAKELLMNSTEIVIPSDDGMGGWRVVLSRRLSSIRRALRRPGTSAS